MANEGTDEQPRAYTEPTSLELEQLQLSAHHPMPMSDSQLELDWLPAADATTTTPPAAPSVLQGTTRDTIYPAHQSPAPASGVQKRGQVTDATTAPGAKRRRASASRSPSGLPAPPATSTTTFSDLPDHLQTILFSCAAAPLLTCKTAAAVWQDPKLAAQWLISHPSLGSALRAAADFEVWDVAHVLVDSLLFDRSNYDHSYALYRAAAAGQPGLVEKLLHQGAWVDELWSGADVELGGCECDEVCDSCGCCHGFALPSDCPYPPALHTLQALGHPLYAAAAYNQSDVCSLLLTQSIHPEIAQLCVHVAARSGHLAALQVLVQEGPPGASQPDLGLNPMFAAARHGHKEVVQLFLGLGADPYNTPGTPWSGGAYYTSCLVEAVRGGSLELVQLLLQEGMSLERDWQQVLETAVRQGDTKLVRLLIDSAHALAGALEQPQQQPATAASAADKTPGIMQQAQSARMCSG